ncbi:MAG: YlmC/YmxH family sporulation protein [Oscillospiraceae bacterium]|jgi:YlmC/YmxH family sporulation protein|nr:YlmC/YmxH family sporulation protein [Oscillospiraceae bacterium]
MECRIADLRCKEVINICDGLRLGYVDDVLLSVIDGRILALIVPGPARFLGLFGHEDDYIVPWERIARIGDDIILIDVKEHRRERRNKKRFW